MLRRLAQRLLPGCAFLALTVGAGDPSQDRALLESAAQSYQALRSYHFTGSYHVELESQGKSQTIDASLVLAATRPGRLREELVHPNVGMLLVSDGRNTWSFAANMGKYRRLPTAARTPVDSGGPAGVGNDARIATGTLTMYREMARGASEIKSTGEETVTFGGESRRCAVVEVTYAEDGLPAGTDSKKTFWIDRERRLVLKHRASALGNGFKQVETVSWSQIRLNASVPDSLFVFRPPAGASEVDDLAAAGPRQSDLSGKKAEDFTLTDLSGRSHKLSAQRGKVVLLDFWASWCGPCRMQMPNVEKLHHEFKQKGLVVYAVNQRESPEVARRYLDKYKYTTTTLLDRDGSVGDRYRVTGIPSLVVIDRKGTIAAHFVGLRAEKDLRAALKKAGLE